MVVNSRCYVARICGARNRTGQRKALKIHAHLSHSLSLSLPVSFILLITASCPRARSTASRRFMKSSGMRFLLAARLNCLSGKPYPTWYTRVLHIYVYFLVLNLLKYTNRARDGQLEWDQRYLRESRLSENEFKFMYEIYDV